MTVHRKEGSVARDVLRGLWSLAHSLERKSKWTHRTYGVTGPQRLLLRVIEDRPGVTPGGAARVLRLNPGTASRLLAGLEQQGLVRTRQDPSDGRRLQVHLTARGRTASSWKAGTLEEAVRRTMGVGTRTEVAATVAFLRRLGDAILPGRPGPRA